MPDELGADREELALYMLERSFVGLEGAVRWEGHLDGGDLRERQSVAVLEQLQGLSDPQHRALSELLVCLVDLQITRAARREVDVLHRGQRHPKQYAKGSSFRFDEHLNRHVGRCVVGRGAQGERQNEAHH